MQSNNDSILFFSPSMGGNVGHGFSYGISLLKHSGQKYDFKIFTIYLPELEKHKQQIVFSRTVFGDSLKKSKYYSRLGGNVRYGLSRILHNIKLIYEFAKISSGYNRIHFLDYEYIAVFIYFLITHRSNKRMFITLHSTDFFWVSSRSIAINLYKYFLRFMIRYIVSKSKTVFVHGDYFKDELIKKVVGNRYKNKIKTVPFGIDTKNGEQQISNSVARKYLELPTKGFLALLFGVIRKGKGVLELIELLAANNVNNIILVIAGSPGDITEDQIKEHLRIINYDNVILKIEYIKETDIQYYYGACDIVFIPHVASHGGFSGPLSLAAKFGVPVFSTGQGQIGKFINDYNLGLCYDPKSFKNKLEYLINNINYFKTNARFKDCVSDNSWDVLSKKLIEEY